MGLATDSDAWARNNAAVLAHGGGQPERTAADAEVLSIQFPGDAERGGEATRPAGEIGRT